MSNDVVDEDVVRLLNKLNRMTGFGLVPNDYKDKPWLLAYHCTHAYNPRHVPVKIPSNNLGYDRWFDNEDGFWTDFHGTRLI